MAQIEKIKISKKSQKALLDYIKDVYTTTRVVNDRRQYMECMDQDYCRIYRQRESDIKAQIEMRNVAPTKYRDIIYPVVMPAVEAAVTYQSSVFCTGTPLFGVVTSPDNADAAAQMEALIDYHATQGAWVVEFNKLFRDGFKYVIGGAVCEWEKLYSPVAGSGPSAEKSGGKPKSTERELVWSGNNVRRLDMYNTIYDPRVDPAKVAQHGEYVMEIAQISALRLKSRWLELGTPFAENYSSFMESSYGGSFGAKYYFPQLGNTLYGTALKTDSSRMREFFNVASSQHDPKLIQSLKLHEHIIAYLRICPADFGIFSAPAANTPQVWKVEAVDWDSLLFAEPIQTDCGILPTVLFEANEDGMGKYTQSYVEHTSPSQQLATTFLNSAVAARRRAVSDRAVYDPQLIDPRSIDTDVPNAKIPLKQGAMMGADVNKAYMAIPFNDNISGTALQEADYIANLAQRLTRQNPARQGQFVKGNKTLSEFQTVMDNANAPDQVTALHLEARIFTPIKSMLKYNTLRFQGPARIFSRMKRQYVQITPESLREAAMEFNISDGLTPSSKLADTDTLQVMLQNLPAVPGVAAEVSLAKVFMAIMQAGGVDVRDYKFSPEEVAYNQALAAWQQQAQLAAERGIEFKVPVPTKPQPQQAQAPQQPLIQ